MSEVIRLGQADQSPHRIPIEHALKLAYHPRTGLRLNQPELEALKAQFIAAGIEPTERATFEGVRTVLRNMGYFILLPYAPHLPRRMVFPHPETLSLDELEPILGTKNQRATFKAAGERGIRMWAYFTGQVELFEDDPIPLDDPNIDLSASVEADFDGFVRLLGIHCRALLERGEAEIGGNKSTHILDHQFGSFVYGGTPIRITMDHVRIFADDIKESPAKRDAPDEPKLPANERHAKVIREELKRRNISEPIQNQKGIGKRGLKAELESEECLKRMRLTLNQFRGGWKCIEKTEPKV